MKYPRTKFWSALPGEAAHLLMAPSPRFIKGVDDKHQEAPKKSAVIVLVVPYDNSMAVVFIKRTDGGGHHSGQISFPGGRMEDEDNSSIDTALRECYEEIGVDTNQISVLGRLSKLYVPVSNFEIYPVIGVTLTMPDFSLSKNEVDSIIIIPFKDLFDKENKDVRYIYRDGVQIKAPGYSVANHFIWGATAMILSELEIKFVN